MYAQLIEGGTTPERRAETDRIVTDELIPALEAEPGYGGAMNLATRERRRVDDRSLANERPGASAARRVWRGVPEGAGPDRGDLNRYARPISVWTVNA